MQSSHLHIGGLSSGRLTVLDMTLKIKLSAGGLLGIACLTAIAVGIFVIPAEIRNSVNDFTVENNARARLNQVIHEDLSADYPQLTAELVPNCPVERKSKPEPESEDLRFARVLTSKGKAELSLPYYQSYLKLDPDRIAVRLELIKACIDSNKMHTARVLCIQTLKKQLNGEESTKVWQHMSRCATD